MNPIRPLVWFAFVTTFFWLNATAPRSEASGNDKNISQAEAKRIALAKVPGGIVQSAKLEKEGLALLWSVDVKMPNSGNITEVHIAANTGKIISVQIETPAEQAAEAAADKKKK